MVLGTPAFLTASTKNQAVENARLGSLLSPAHVSAALLLSAQPWITLNTFPSFLEASHTRMYTLRIHACTLGAFCDGNPFWETSLGVQSTRCPYIGTIALLLVFFNIAWHYMALQGIAWHSQFHQPTCCWKWVWTPLF